MLGDSGEIYHADFRSDNRGTTCPIYPTNSAGGNNRNFCGGGPGRFSWGSDYIATTWLNGSSTGHNSTMALTDVRNRRTVALPASSSSSATTDSFQDDGDILEREGPPINLFNANSTTTADLCWGVGAAAEDTIVCANENGMCSTKKIGANLDVTSETHWQVVSQPVGCVAVSATEHENVGPIVAVGCSDNSLYVAPMAKD